MGSSPRAPDEGANYRLRSRSGHHVGTVQHRGMTKQMVQGSIRVEDKILRHDLGTRRPARRGTKVSLISHLDEKSLVLQDERGTLLKLQEPKEALRREGRFVRTPHAGRADALAIFAFYVIYLYRYARQGQGSDMDPHQHHQRRERRRQPTLPATPRGITITMSSTHGVE